MRINCNFMGGGGGAKQKTFHWGSMDIFWNCTIQSNPAISDSVNSKSPLFRGETEFPWIYPYMYFFSHLLSAISNSVISNSPLFQTDPCFPRPKST